jgi:hypothetical protein
MFSANPEKSTRMKMMFERFASLAASVPCAEDTLTYLNCVILPIQMLVLSRRILM